MVALAKRLVRTKVSESLRTYNHPGAKPGGTVSQPGLRTAELRNLGSGRRYVETPGSGRRSHCFSEKIMKKDQV